MHLNQTISYKELYETVWGKKYMKDDLNIMAHIHRMRRKMGDDTQNSLYIQNVYGLGYRIEGKLRMDKKFLFRNVRKTIMRSLGFLAFGDHAAI